MPYNERKFKELVLYVAHRCGLDPNFGAVKLNKELFFSDFWAYAEFGGSNHRSGLHQAALWPRA